MDQLPWPDQHRFNAAQGWLELGDTEQALLELNEMSPCVSDELPVLQFAWMLHAHRKDWSSALECAQRLLDFHPQDHSGWVDLSFSLHELRRTAEARDNLLAVARQFPEVATIPYNLACYEAQLGNLDQAYQWLSKALKKPNSNHLRESARSDPDLEPLRQKFKLPPSADIPEL
jgi:tetratricopeptide (TPR) repeat protein